MTKLTYKPGPHSPVTTTFHGLTLEANIPIELTDADVAEIDVVDLIPNDDGLVRSRTVKKRIPLLELAKNNPSGELLVEGHEARKPGRPPVPKTAEQYKAWATRWIGECLDHEVLESRWKKEAALRVACQADGEAISRELNALFSRRHAELKRAAGDHEKGRAQREAELTEGI